MSPASESNPQRFRISPRGLINFASKERNALGRFVDVSVQGKNVHLTPAGKSGSNTVKVSPRGLLQLPSDAHKALSGGKRGYYSVSHDEKGINLQPA
jgi:hypothetical protein